ncbi:Cytochrome b561 and DOMON domain-containing protein [Hibiscus syriacus]|uniref:Cytochrome b561 and DOMON domain-containing protein n=1 Tax=Hibiscus syriacus TaxID=106335 RepID=A0A6A3BUF0_HIBSY|nr:cytochrome b561 and DOMON domain-containing protein At5g35735-like [Hibiscus syriacus]KAE8720284.1 Cytochrome b561 and DOMON domain-containing protein [Hibiscus syriacus]
MDKTCKLVLLSCLLLSFLASSSAQICLTQRFPDNRQYDNCNDLPALTCFLHWTYDQAAGTLNVAFRHTGTTDSRWTAWGLNPSGPRMQGTQALVAFVNSTGVAQAFTTSIDSMVPSMQPSPLSFQVPTISARFDNNEMTIFAVMRISDSWSSTSQVWQEGPVNNGQLGIHSLSGANVRSAGTVNFLTGQSGGSSGGSRTRRRNVHGVLNTVSWGILMPLGAITARYMKVFKSADPAWFYLHVACQTSAYAVGVAGWATGIKLGSDSPGITHNPHRNIGIALFCLGTLQVFALLLRPNKDHKYRLYWNIYHHSVGYTVIILSIINIFEGFDILNPDDHWERIYIGILIFLGIVATLLEAFTWYVVLMRKKKGSDKHSHSINGANGVRGQEV